MLQISETAPLDEEPQSAAGLYSVRCKEFTLKIDSKMMVVNSRRLNRIQYFQYHGYSADQES